MEKTFQAIAGISEIADKYDALILDIWGVIHDGQATYPGVLECLDSLKAADKKILFLSNAPRRSTKVKAVLRKFGIQNHHYIDAVSSGETSFHYISKHEPANSKFVYIGPEKDRDLMNGSSFVQTESPEEATFALATGFDNDSSTLEEKLPQMEACLKAGLKLYCANPDLLVVRQNGTKMLCAGVIGEEYAKMGGEAKFIGKPHPEVYERCFEIFAENGVNDKSRVLAVGDNLDTDILGANQVGIDSALCLGGVLKAQTKPAEEIIEEMGVYPTYTIPQFNF